MTSAKGVPIRARLTNARDINVFHTPDAEGAKLRRARNKTGCGVTGMKRNNAAEQ